MENGPPFLGCDVAFYSKTRVFAKTGSGQT
jgi:hypothetical protein